MTKYSIVNFCQQRKNGRYIIFKAFWNILETIPINNLLPKWSHSILFCLLENEYEESAFLQKWSRKQVKHYSDLVFFNPFSIYKILDSNLRPIIQMSFGVITSESIIYPPQDPIINHFVLHETYSFNTLRFQRPWSPHSNFTTTTHCIDVSTRLLSPIRQRLNQFV